MKRLHTIMRGNATGSRAMFEPGDGTRIVGCLCVGEGAETKAAVGRAAVRCASCGEVFARPFDPADRDARCATHRIIRLVTSGIFACLDCDGLATESRLETMAEPWAMWNATHVVTMPTATVVVADEPKPRRPTPVARVLAWLTPNVVRVQREFGARHDSKRLCFAFGARDPQARLRRWLNGSPVVVVCQTTKTFASFDELYLVGTMPEEADSRPGDYVWDADEVLGHAKPAFDLALTCESTHPNGTDPHHVMRQIGETDDDLLRRAQAADVVRRFPAPPLPGGLRYAPPGSGCTYGSRSWAAWAEWAEHPAMRADPYLALRIARLCGAFRMGPTTSLEAVVAAARNDLGAEAGWMARLDRYVDEEHADHAARVAAFDEVVKTKGGAA